MNVFPSRTLDQLGAIYRNEFKNNSNVNIFNLKDASKVTMCSSSRETIESYLECVAKLGYVKINDEHFLAADFLMKQTLTSAFRPGKSLKLYQNFFNIGKRQTSFANPFKNFNIRKRLTLIGHFNNQPYHLAPLSVNLLTNTLLKYFTRSLKSTINVINHPLPRNLTDITNDMTNKDLTSFNIASGLAFGFSFLIASFSIILIKERESGSKHLQFMNGCNSIVFWLSAFVWDMINYTIPVLLVIGLLKVTLF